MNKSIKLTPYWIIESNKIKKVSGFVSLGTSTFGIFRSKKLHYFDEDQVLQHNKPHYATKKEALTALKNSLTEDITWNDSQIKHYQARNNESAKLLKKL